MAKEIREYEEKWCGIYAYRVPFVVVDWVPTYAHCSDLSDDMEIWYDLYLRRMSEAKKLLKNRRMTRGQKDALLEYMKTAVELIHELEVVLFR